MLKAAKAAGQITHAHSPLKAVVPDENNRVFTLEEAGINRKLSSRAQQIANVPKEEFETAISSGARAVVVHHLRYERWHQRRFSRQRPPSIVSTILRWLLG
jgi:hypothetical protein